MKNWDATIGLGTPKTNALFPFLVALNFLHNGDDAIAYDK